MTIRARSIHLLSFQCYSWFSDKLWRHGRLQVGTAAFEATKKPECWVFFMQQMQSTMESLHVSSMTSPASQFNDYRQQQNKIKKIIIIQGIVLYFLTVPRTTWFCFYTLRDFRSFWWLMMKRIDQNFNICTFVQGQSHILQNSSSSSILLNIWFRLNSWSRPNKIKIYPSRYFSRMLIEFSRKVSLWFRYDTRINRFDLYSLFYTFQGKKTRSSVGREWKKDLRRMNSHFTFYRNQDQREHWTVRFYRLLMMLIWSPRRPIEINLIMVFSSRLRRVQV